MNAELWICGLLAVIAVAAVYIERKLVNTNYALFQILRILTKAMPEKEDDNY